jgi:hypothetical protein
MNEPIERNITLLYILKMLFSDYPSCIDEHVFRLLFMTAGTRLEDMTNSLNYLERREMISHAHKKGKGFDIRFYFLTGKGFLFCQKKYA